MSLRSRLELLETASAPLDSDVAPRRRKRQARIAVALAPDEHLETWARAQRVRVAAVATGLFEAADALDEHRAALLVVPRRRALLALTRIPLAMLDAALEAEGVRCVSAAGEGSEDSPEGRLVRALVDAVDAYAVATGRDFGALFSTAVARAPGTAPYGQRFADDGSLEDDPTEAPIVERIRAERASGLSIQSIVDGLTEDGVPARGGRWHATTIQRILSRTP